MNIGEHISFLISVFTFFGFIHKSEIVDHMVVIFCFFFRDLCVVFYSVCVSRSVMSDSVTPMNYSLPGSSIHGILQARILEWLAISFSISTVDVLTYILANSVLGFSFFFTSFTTVIIYYPFGDRLPDRCDGKWVAIFLLQGIFPTQESNLGLLHCRQILYRLNYKGSPLYHLL